MDEHEREIEVGVGDTLQVGDYFVTILDVEGDEIRIRIESEDGSSFFASPPDAESLFLMH